MVSRYYLLRILLFTLLVALTLAGCMLAWSRDAHPAIGLGGLLLLLLEIVVFVRQMNVLNRQLNSFLLALQNQDSATGPGRISSRRMKRELQEALGRTLEAFREMKFEYAAREQLFMSMIENSSTGFISIDAHGDFEIMNQAARKLLGTHFTSNLSRLQEEMPLFHGVLTRLEEGEAGTCTVHGPEGASLVRVAPARMKFREQEFTLVSIQDIRREVDARELESYQKLIRILNHEIMNSIAPITSASRSLRSLFLHTNRPVEPSGVDEQMIADTLDGLEIIGAMSAGLQHFVESYRKLSRIPEPVKVRIDLCKWSRRLKALSTELVDKDGASLEIHLEEGCSILEADEGLLNQVMLNLVRNALQAPGPSSVKRKVEIGIQGMDGGRTCIRVKNNGEPIPPGEMDKIFIPFYTTREEGAGIGLFLSRQIISMHRGTLDAYTAPDGDTVFEILL